MDYCPICGVQVGGTLNSTAHRCTICGNENYCSSCIRTVPSEIHYGYLCPSCATKVNSTARAIAYYEAKEKAELERAKLCEACNTYYRGRICPYCGGKGPLFYKGTVNK